MSHIHRIQWFDQQIKAGRYPNSNHLAGQFEISKRQAQRDIEYMASSLRAPLQYVAKQRGYCYEDDSFMLPYLYITDQEKQILKYLAYRYSLYNYENGPAVRRIGSLLERLTDDQELKEVQLPIFTVNPHVLQYIELLEHAIRDCLIVRIVYDRQENEFEIWPVKLVNHYDDDHVIAKTAGHLQPQHFQLSSIRSLKLTDRRFSEAPEGRLRQEQVRKLKPFTAQIRLAAPPRGETWLGFPIRHVDEDITPNIYEVDFWDSEIFVQHLLSTEWLQILAPKWLQDKISKYMLSGLSGMAFKFSVHRRLLPMSVTAYGQWGNEHAPAIDNLGIHTSYDGGRTRHSSFEAYQQDAITAQMGSPHGQVIL